MNWATYVCQTYNRDLQGTVFDIQQLKLWKKRMISVYLSLYILLGFSGLIYTSRITFSGNRFPDVYNFDRLRPTYKYVFRNEKVDCIIIIIVFSMTTILPPNSQGLGFKCRFVADYSFVLCCYLFILHQGISSQPFNIITIPNLLLRPIFEAILECL